MLSRRGMVPPGNIRPPPAFIAQVEDLIKSMSPDQTAALVEAIHHTERSINRTLERVMHTLEELLDVMTAQRTKIDGINALLIGLKGQVKSAVGESLTPTQQMRIDRVFDQATANSAEMDKALTENTSDATSPKPPEEIEADLQKASDKTISDQAKEEDLRNQLKEIEQRKKQIVAEKAKADQAKATAAASQPPQNTVPNAAPSGPVDAAGQQNQLPEATPNGPSDEWPGDPNNFGAPTTQTRNTRPGLPDTPGVPNTGASAQGGSAVPSGQLTNAPGETRNINDLNDTRAAQNAEATKLGIGAALPVNPAGPMTDPQGDLTLPAGSVADVGERDPSWTGGSALSPSGTTPAATTTDTTDPTVPDNNTLRADGGVSFVDPLNPPSPTGVDLGTDKQKGKAGLDPDFLPQQGNPAVAGASNQSGAGDKGPAVSTSGTSSADN